MAVNYSKFGKERPKKILRTIGELKLCKGSGVIRLCNRPGDGKSQGVLCLSQAHDIFCSFVFQTVLDKRKAFEGLKDDGVIEGLESYLICSWKKALGVKDGKKYQIDPNRLPDSFTDLWNTPKVDDIAELTLKEGSEIAKDEYSNSKFYKEWKNHLKPSNMQGKIIFSTVSMIAFNPHIPKELETDIIAVDEGLQGRTAGRTFHSDRSTSAIEDAMEGLIKHTYKTLQNGYSYRYKQVSYSDCKVMDSSQVDDLNEIIEGVCCHLQNLEIEIQNGKGEEMDFEDVYGNKETVGRVEWKDISKKGVSNLARNQKALNSLSGYLVNYRRLNRKRKNPHGSMKIPSVLKQERRNNPKLRKLLIEVQKTFRFAERLIQNGLTYKRKNKLITKCVSSEHYLHLLEPLSKRLLLMNATYSKKWDETRTTPIQYLLKSRSLRNTDLTNYSAKINHVRKNDKKIAIGKNSLTNKKMVYLYRLLNETDQFKITPKEIENYFDGQHRTYEEATGVSLENIDESTIIYLPRLSFSDIVFEFSKEFGEMPSKHPENDKKLGGDGSVHGFYSKDNQIIWEINTESKTVDSFFRIARSRQDKAFTDYIGLITDNIKNNWFGNFSLYSQGETIDQFIDRIVKGDRYDIDPQKAIELAKKVNATSKIEDYEWTQNKGDKMSVNPNWAIEKLLKDAETHDIIGPKDVQELSGRNYNTCNSALRNFNQVVQRAGQKDVRLEKTHGGWIVVSK